MTVQDAYNHWSATYDTDRNLTRDLDALATHSVLGEQPPAITLEIGCGTGKNTALLAQISPCVIALDFSAGMLRLAKSKVTAPQVTFCTADLTRPWPLRADAVERIVCNLVLEHIADLDPIFAEARRVLQPGGLFFLSELHPYRQYQGSQANFNNGVEQITVPAFVHAISDFTRAAQAHGFAIHDLQEWWDTPDRQKPPRLVTFLFAKN